MLFIDHVSMEVTLVFESGFDQKGGKINFLRQGEGSDPSFKLECRVSLYDQLSKGKTNVHSLLLICNNLFISSPEDAGDANNVRAHEKCVFKVSAKQV